MQNVNTVVTNAEQVTGSPANPTLITQNVDDVSEGQTDSVNAGTVQSPQAQSSNNTDLITPEPALNVQTTSSEPITLEQPATHDLGGTQGAVLNHRLKQLKVPTFDGDKTKFEEYWGLFQSLVDMSSEPVCLKMARLRQSLTGRALESIRGLGVSTPEYEEAKEILKSKFGGQRRQLRAYLDELENMVPLNNKDLRGFEKFADLVRVTVVKLQAEGKSGELSDGTLHSLLVKNLTERKLESYTRWMSEHDQARSVICLRDWLKEEVAIRVDAGEMAHGVDADGDKDHSGRIPKFPGKKNRRTFANK